MQSDAATPIEAGDAEISVRAPLALVQLVQTAGESGVALVELGANGLADMTVETVKRRLVLSALSYCGGDVDWAAQELGVNQSTLYRWRRRWQREGRGVEYAVRTIARSAS